MGALILLLGALLPASVQADMVNDVSHAVISQNAAGGNGYAIGQALGTGISGVLTSASMYVHAQTPFSPCLNYTLHEYDTPTYGFQKFSTRHWYSSPLFCGMGTYDGQYTASFPSIQLDPTKYYVIGPDTQAYTGWGAIQVYGDASTSYANQPIGSLDSNGAWGPNYPDSEIKSAWFSLTGVSQEGTTTPPATTTPSGPSSVMFLPGIEGTRLYAPNDGCDPRGQNCFENKLWEPNGDQNIKDLYLDRNGQSNNPNVYGKVGDVVDSSSFAGITQQFYTSLISDLDELQASSTANGGSFSWRPVAYDWRLSLTDIVRRGREVNGKIFYEDATSTPYIKQTLYQLAASSPTGKVTIIAHSNGGLVAKDLMYELGDSETSRLIDKVIFVGVPQSGAPRDVGAMLFGYGTALPRDDCSAYPLVGKLCSKLMSREVGRAFASTSPMAYHLLPTDRYFNVLNDPTHSVISFSDAASYPKEVAAYGTTIDNEYELASYLAGNDGGRVQPSTADTSNPSILDDANLIRYGSNIHSSLDGWTPPAGVILYQVAGWGADTISGIHLYKNFPLLFGSVTDYRPQFIEDGDGIVPVPSAHMIPASENVKDYWVDLASYNRDTHSSNEHSSLLETNPTLSFLGNILTDTMTALPEYVLDSRPTPNVPSKRLIYYIHSPISMGATDMNGRFTGVSNDGVIHKEIPDSQYGELGEVKYIIVPAGTQHTVTLTGQGTGTFSLDIAEQIGNDVVASTTFALVPTTVNTEARITATNGVSDASPLTVDEDGDGTIDLSLTPVLNGVVTPPKPILSVIPNGVTVEYGSPIPLLFARLEGFDSGDSATSTTSGFPECTTDAVQGSPVGVYTITCSKGTLTSVTYDFSTQATGTLQIIYRFDGFLQPINDTAHQVGQGLSVFKAGSTVPVKLQLKDTQGNPLQASTSPIWLAPQRGAAMNTAVGEPVYSDPETAGNTFRWDPVFRGYIYNWKTKNYAKGYWYRIYAQLDDGKTYSVVVGLK